MNQLSAKPGILFAEVESYVKIKLRMPSGEVTRWLFPGAVPRLVYDFPTTIEPMICARCGYIHGECLGGKVWIECPECVNRTQYPELASTVSSIQVTISVSPYSEWPQAIVARELAEVYKHVDKGILQYSSESARERAIHYSQNP